MSSEKLSLPVSVTAPVPTPRPSRSSTGKLLTLAVLSTLLVLWPFHSSLSSSSDSWGLDSISSHCDEGMSRLQSMMPGGLAKEPLKRANQLLAKWPLIDGHIDLPILARMKYRNQPYEMDLNEEGFPGHVDIPRLRKGGVGGFFWSVYVGCPPDGSGNSEEGDYLNATWRVRDTLEQIDVAKLLVEEYKDTFHFSTSVSDIKHAYKHGKIASLLGVEGGHQLGNSLSTLRQYYDLGVRYITLTHTCHNAFADSCGLSYDMPMRWGGLSDFGKTLVKEMNRLGMIVDISHVSAATASDVLSLSLAPPIFSHSVARGVHDFPRNVPDSILLRIGRTSSQTAWDKVSDIGTGVAEGNGWGMGEEEFKEVKGGDAIIMVNFVPAFLSGGKSDVSTVADHIDRIANLAGKDKVGLGSDYDGIDSTPEGLEDVSTYPVLIAELIRRGWTDREIHGLTRRNIIRVMTKVEKVAHELQKGGAKPKTEIYDKRTDL